MLNDYGSLLNSSVLGSAGWLKTVRLISTGSTCQAVSPVSRIGSRDRAELFGVGYAQATSSSRLTAKRRVVGVGTASASGAMSLAIRHPVSIASVGYAQATSASTLRILSRLISVGQAVADGGGELTAQCRRRLVGYGTATCISPTPQLRVYRRSAGIGVAGAAGYGALRHKVAIKSSGQCSAVAASQIRRTRADHAPDERTAYVPENNRVAYVTETSMGIVGSYTKQPREVLDYDISFEDFIESGDSLVSADVSVSPAGLTIDSHLVIGDRVKVWLSGGTNGVTYKVTALVTTDFGRTKEDEIKVKVKEV